MSHLRSHPCTSNHANSTDIISNNQFVINKSDITLLRQFSGVGEDPLDIPRESIKDSRLKKHHIITLHARRTKAKLEPIKRGVKTIAETRLLGVINHQPASLESPRKYTPMGPKQKEAALEKDRGWNQREPGDEHADAADQQGKRSEFLPEFFWKSSRKGREPEGDFGATASLAALAGG